MQGSTGKITSQRTLKLAAASRKVKQISYIIIDDKINNECVKEKKISWMSEETQFAHCRKV